MSYQESFSLKDSIHCKCSFFTFFKIEFLYCIFARLISSGTDSSNGWAIMVRVVKNLPKWNLHFSFLYFLQVFEWWCIWHVLTSLNKIGSLIEYGRSDLTIPSTHLAYSSMLNFVNLCAFKIQINECVWASSNLKFYSICIILNQEQ